MDWTGNTNSVYTTLGASNHSAHERETHDYYATDPRALEVLLLHEDFSKYIWEPACGGGHLSEVLLSKGYDVKSSDIVDRGFKDTQIIDFLKVDKEQYKNDIPRDIITNPPYKYAKDFVKKALDISMYGVKVAMFLKLTFLEGQARKELFKKYPPKTVYVFSKRVECAKKWSFYRNLGGSLCLVRLGKRLHRSA